MATLSLENVKKSYDTTEILHGIDLQIEKGEFIVFVGPSGCGKSTLLRMIAGLELISSGDLSIDGQRVNELPPAERGIAMVFQSYALYPHMTVFENMAFGLRIANTAQAEIDKRVQNAAQMLQLEPYLERHPKALSGGQRQRVAIGRAIVRDPKIFLFDEPLSNLDAALRVNTRIEISNLKEGLPDTTMIYVTHDQVEAMTLADRIVVLNGGYIEQVGTPIELYTNPASVFVAKFIGSPSMNILPASITKTGENTQVCVDCGANTTTAIETSSHKQDAKVYLGIRPEDFQLASQEDMLLEGSVAFIELLGEVTLLHIRCAGVEENIVAKLQGIVRVAKGSTIRLKAAKESIHVFDAEKKSLRKEAPDVHSLQTIDPAILIAATQ